METYPVNIDPLVQPLLLEQNDEQADALFTHLLKEHVERVVKGVIRYKLHLSPETPITGYEEWNRQKRTVVPMPAAFDDRLIENVRAQLKKDPQNLAPFAAR